MRVLVIGGTQFVGRALTEALLAHGDTPTLFHRGRTGADLFPAVEHVLGDRNEGFAPLAGRTWDAVVDVCAYFPRQTRLLNEALAGQVGQGAVVSTISVYEKTGAAGYDEQSARIQLEDPTVEEVTGDTYGGLKTLVEDEFLTAWDDRALVVRPTLVAGPHDPTDRFTTWPVWLHRGPTRVPDRPDQPVQWVDARDLAEFLVRALHAGRSGIVNAAHPNPSIPWREFITRVAEAVGHPEHVRWTDPATLTAEGLEPWGDLPYVLPYDGSGDPTLRVDGTRMQDVATAYRPLEETVRDTLAWYLADRKGQPLRFDRPAK